MLFQHVAIAGLAHIDAPRRLTSDEIHARLKPTLDRLGIKYNVLEEVAGVRERRLWDGEVKASDAATLAARQDPGRMNQLILSEWRDDDYGVGAVVGRIMRCPCTGGDAMDVDARLQARFLARRLLVSWRGIR